MEIKRTSGHDSDRMGRIKPGIVFEYGTELFIKIRKEGGIGWNAVNLENGDLWNINHGSDIVIIKGYFQEDRD